MLKKTSGLQILSRSWFFFMLLSIFLYFLSFVLYYYILRIFPISKIYPIMTICVIILITNYGFLIGEYISLRQIVGLVVGMGSIYLILS